MFIGCTNFYEVGPSKRLTSNTHPGRRRVENRLQVSGGPVRVGHDAVRVVKHAINIYEIDVYDTTLSHRSNHGRLLRRHPYFQSETLDIRRRRDRSPHTTGKKLHALKHGEVYFWGNGTNVPWFRSKQPRTDNGQK